MIDTFNSCTALTGRGVFAAQEFRKGEFLMVYDGEVISAKEGERREAVEETGYRFFLNHYKDGKAHRMW